MTAFVGNVKARYFSYL